MDSVRFKRRKFVELNQGLRRANFFKHLLRRSKEEGMKKQLHRTNAASSSSSRPLDLVVIGEA